jgi:hypothetical protein
VRCGGKCPGSQFAEAHDMTRLLLAGAAALGIMTGVATAQTTTSETTTTTAPTPLAPPPGTLSTTTTRKSVGFGGTQTESTGTTYRDSNGVAGDSVTRTTTYPPPAPPPAAVTTTQQTTTSTTHQ